MKIYFTLFSFSVKPSNDSVKILGEPDQLYDGMKIELICTAGPSYPGKQGDNTKTIK